MTLSELRTALGMDNKDVIVHIINPIRKGDEYKSGQVIGFKPGLFGGGHSDWKKDNKDGGVSTPHTFNSLDMHWLKKPKAMVLYNSFTWGGKMHFDWIEVDNCDFEIKETK